MAEPGIEPLVKVRDFSKIYGRGCPLCTEMTGPAYERNICPACGTIVACSGVSFDVYPGEIIGIVGESGSGKSTLIKALYFDEEASGGEVQLSCYEDGKTNILSLSSQKKKVDPQPSARDRVPKPSYGPQAGFFERGQHCGEADSSGLVQRVED